MKRRRSQTEPIAKKKYVTKSTAGWFVFGVLVSIQIFFAIQVSTFGGELSVLEDRSNELTKENQGLRTVVITKLSLTDAEEKSEGMGFAKPGKIVFVQKSDTSTALR